MIHTIDTPRKLGELIRQVRKAQGLRQDDLAGVAGSSHVFVLEVERGKPTAQFGKVLDLLRELGIRLIAEIPETRAPGKSRSRKRAQKPDG
jgi:y4mF family transcriptional regulator